MTSLLVGAVLLLCLLPSLLFLGFWNGLVHMQRRSLIARTSSRAGHSDPTVTWSDVIDAYADPRHRLLAAPSEPQSATTRDGQCAACATVNDSIASFCRNCGHTLE
ncbi:hypothetical protein [Natrinema altunense]|uniref:Uncharacterized protein n=1 Tax=Natrinema altunense (strain JCM 12890 / CGMCC 1.3731 / AJ2) TaxID=1227494 RepID=L9ZJS3_NATA2|nr:hypothetical protein [Natrinema altunense]ELY85837.1 hypothetical protein C485_11568 [Natrinema altunense JCM 12890]